MNIAHTIHTLETIAVVVLVGALALPILALSLGIAWRGRLPKGWKR